VLAFISVGFSTSADTSADFENGVVRVPLNLHLNYVDNLLFDFKHGDNRTPISPVRDIVKRFSSGAPQQSEIRTSTAENCLGDLNRAYSPGRRTAQRAEISARRSYPNEESNTSLGSAKLDQGNLYKGTGPGTNCGNPIHLKLCNFELTELRNFLYCLANPLGETLARREERR
jgi:hypothetical protein